MKIRRARPEDIDPALAVIGAAFGFELQAPTVHTMIAGLPDGHLLVAESEGRIVGTGGAIGFGATGWLGGIAVAPEARGSGLGRTLTEASLDALGERETVLLLASALGRPIYDRLGFVAECRYRVFMTTADGTAPDVVAADSRELDRQVTGEDRSAVLNALTAVTDGNAIAVRTPFPALPIIGRDGSALLGLAAPGTRLAVPEANEAAVAAILAMGAEEREPVTRMYRGARVDWHPEQVWGVFSLFFA